MSNKCTDSCIGALCPHWPFGVEREIAYYDDLIKACREQVAEHNGDPFYRQKLWNYEVKRAELQARLDKAESAKTREIK